jgi:hypothetical protein
MSSATLKALRMLCASSLKGIERTYAPMQEERRLHALVQVAESDQLNNFLLTLDEGTLRLLSGDMRETPTHFKWLIATGREGHSFWVHRYKTSVRRTQGFVENVHNHRYDFVSHILSGAYLHTEVDVELDLRDCSTALDEIAPVTRRVDVSSHLLSSGDSWAIRNDQFHRIERPSDDCQTLLLQNPACKAFSWSLLPDGQGAIRHFDGANVEMLKPGALGGARLAGV